MAADELGLTQAAISKQIRSLEDSLGVTLFERRNRAVHLTEEGRDFSLVVSEAFGSICSQALMLRSRNEREEVVLRSQLCEGLYWLMPRLSEFYQKHPEIPVRVSVSTRPLSETVDRFDLALQSTERNCGSARLVFTASDEVFPVCSPGYLDRTDNPLTLEALSEHHLLHHKVQPQDWIDWDRWLTESGLDLRVGSKGNVYDSYPMMMQAVLEGHGIALGWRRTVEHYLESGLILRPFGDSVSLPDGLSVYQPAKQHAKSGTAVLLEWLKQELT